MPILGGHGPRTYQDERFSYVVLRRGARPGAAADLQIARHLVGASAPDPELYRTEPAHWKGRRLEEQVGPLYSSLILSHLYFNVWV